MPLESTPEIQMPVLMIMTPYYGASPEEIDRINILQATYQAMRKAIAGLKPAPDLLLNDAVVIPQVEIKQVKIIKAMPKVCPLRQQALWQK